MSERTDTRKSGDVFLDVRGAGRSMRLSWHPEADIVVLSLWRGDTCVGTFRMPQADVDDFVDALVEGLRALPGSRFASASRQPTAATDAGAGAESGAGSAPRPKAAPAVPARPRVPDPDETPTQVAPLDDRTPTEQLAAVRESSPTEDLDVTQPMTPPRPSFTEWAFGPAEPEHRRHAS